MPDKIKNMYEQSSWVLGSCENAVNSRPKRAQKQVKAWPFGSSMFMTPERKSHRRSSECQSGHPSLRLSLLALSAQLLRNRREQERQDGLLDREDVALHGGA